MLDSNLQLSDGKAKHLTLCTNKIPNLKQVKARFITQNFTEKHFEIFLLQRNEYKNNSFFIFHRVSDLFSIPLSVVELKFELVFSGCYILGPWKIESRSFLLVFPWKSLCHCHNSWTSVLEEYWRKVVGGWIPLVS